MNGKAVGSPGTCVTSLSSARITKASSLHVVDVAPSWTAREPASMQGVSQDALRTTSPKPKTRSLRGSNHPPLAKGMASTG